MGTNYYHETGVCEHCGHAKQRRHIGKSSFGWCFSLHVEPDDPTFPHSWDDWMRDLKAFGRIVDEGGTTLTTRELADVVTNRGINGRYCHKDAIDQDPSDAWLIENHAELGPYGVVRHRIDGRHCIGHGEGTWDLIRGEFS